MGIVFIKHIITLQLAEGEYVEFLSLSFLCLSKKLLSTYYVPRMAKGAKNSKQKSSYSSYSSSNSNKQHTQKARELNNKFYVENKRQRRVKWAWESVQVGLWADDIWDETWSVGRVRQKVRGRAFQAQGTASAQASKWNELGVNPVKS